MESELGRMVAEKEQRWETVWNRLIEKCHSDDERSLEQEFNSMRLMCIMMYLKHGWGEDNIIQSIENLIG